MIPDCELVLDTASYNDTSSLVDKVIFLNSKDKAIWKEFPVAVMTADSSEQSAIVSPLLAGFQMSQVAYRSGGVKLNALAASGFFFRSCPVDSRLLTVTAKLVKHLHWSEVVVMSSEWSAEALAYFSQIASVYGYTVYGSMNAVKPYDMTGDTESESSQFGEAVNQLRSVISQSHTRSFVLLLTNEETWPLMRVANKAGGVGPGFTWLNSYTLVQIPPESEGLADGVYADGTSDPWYVLLSVDRTTVLLHL